MDGILLRTIHPRELWRHCISGLQSAQDEDIQQFLREEVEMAVEAPVQEKSAGADNIPAEFVQVGG